MDITETSARQISVAILEMAVDDWKRYKLTTSWPNTINRLCRGGYPRAGFVSPREELLDFFNGAMCASMLEVLGIPPDRFRQQLNIPDKDTA